MRKYSGQTTERENGLRRAFRIVSACFIVVKMFIGNSFEKYVLSEILDVRMLVGT